MDKRRRRKRPKHALRKEGKCGVICGNESAGCAQATGAGQKRRCIARSGQALSFIYANHFLLAVALPAGHERSAGHKRGICTKRRWRARGAPDMGRAPRQAGGEARCAQGRAKAGGGAGQWKSAFAAPHCALRRAGHARKMGNAPKAPPDVLRCHARALWRSNPLFLARAWLYCRWGARRFVRALP